MCISYEQGRSAPSTSGYQHQGVLATHLGPCSGHQSSRPALHNRTCMVGGRGAARLPHPRRVSGGLQPGGTSLLPPLPFTFESSCPSSRRLFRCFLTMGGSVTGALPSGPRFQGFPLLSPWSFAQGSSPAAVRECFWGPTDTGENPLSSDLGIHSSARPCLSSWTQLLFYSGYSHSVITRFDACIALDSATGSPSKLAPVSS